MTENRYLRRSTRRQSRMQEGGHSQVWGGEGDCDIRLNSRADRVRLISVETRWDVDRQH